MPDSADFKRERHSKWKKEKKEKYKEREWGRKEGRSGRKKGKDLVVGCCFRLCFPRFLGRKGKKHFHEGNRGANGLRIKKNGEASFDGNKTGTRISVAFFKAAVECSLRRMTQTSQMHRLGPLIDADEANVYEPKCVHRIPFSATGR